MADRHEGEVGQEVLRGGAAGEGDYQFSSSVIAEDGDLGVGEEVVDGGDKGRVEGGRGALAAVEGEGCEAGDCESGVALEDGVEGWVNLRLLVLAYTDDSDTTDIYNICWWCGGGALTVHTRLNRILSRSQLRGESEGQRSCDGSKSNTNWLHGEESVGLVSLQLP